MDCEQPSWAMVLVFPIVSLWQRSTSFARSVQLIRQVMNGGELFAWLVRKWIWRNETEWILHFQSYALNASFSFFLQTPNALYVKFKYSHRDKDTSWNENRTIFLLFYSVAVQYTHTHTYAKKETTAHWKKF